jgi:hypothetical protein
VSAVVRSTLVVILCSLFPALSRPGGTLVAKPNDNERGRIEIRVYDLAGVAPKTLAEAERQAGRVFHKAGIETEWHHVILAGAPNPEGLAGLPPPYQSTFVLRILDNEMSEKLDIREEALGYAITCPVEERGCIANLLYPRLVALSEQGDASLSEILGYALAHELGHLLLSANAHSRTGVMQARWTGETLREASRGRLLFTAEQAEQIRKEVLIRLTLTACLR